MRVLHIFIKNHAYWYLLHCRSHEPNIEGHFHSHLYADLVLLSVNLHCMHITLRDVIESRASLPRSDVIRQTEYDAIAVDRKFRNVRHFDDDAALRREVAHVDSEHILRGNIVMCYM